MASVAKQWGPVFLRWTTGCIRNESWRVGCWAGADDLLQDGWIFYHELRKRYPSYSNRRLFALYRRRFVWHLYYVERQNYHERQIKEEMLERMSREGQRPARKAVHELLPPPPVLVQRLLDRLGISKDELEPRTAHVPSWAKSSRDALNTYFLKKLRIYPLEVDLIALVEQWLGTELRLA